MAQCNRKSPPTVSFRLRLTPERRKFLESRASIDKYAPHSLANLLFSRTLDALIRLESTVGLDGFLKILGGLGEETEVECVARTRKEIEDLASAAEWTGRCVSKLQTAWLNEMAARVTSRRPRPKRELGGGGNVTLLRPVS